MTTNLIIATYSGRYYKFDSVNNNFNDTIEWNLSSNPAIPQLQLTNSSFAINSSLIYNIQIVNSNYVVDNLIKDLVIIANTSSLAITITLPSVSLSVGRNLIIKNKPGVSSSIVNSFNNVTINTFGTDKIEETVTGYTLVNFASLNLISDGSSWNLI